MAAEDPTEATANLIADVAPDQGALAAVAVSGSQVLAATERTAATVPLDASQPITIEDIAGAGNAADGSVLPGLEVYLPDEIATGDGRVADDGTVVYHATNGGADAVVQVLDDGSVRIQTVTLGATGPHDFTYTFGEGVAPAPAPDGTIELVADAANGAKNVVGVIDQPWAVDANGQAVETTYTIQGGSLVQTVDADDSTAYPVVADPQIRPGNGIYVRFSKSETRTIANNGIWLTASTGLCAVIPIIGVAGACAFIDAVFKDSLRNTFAKARNANQCVELRYTWFLTTWRLNSWKGISC